MQKLVVRAVSAESALEKAAAIIPIINITGTSVPNCPPEASMGKRSSVCCGGVMEFWAQ